VLDTLIRAKLAKMGDCRKVDPLPVAWRRRENGGCNWEIPGWIGDGGEVQSCLEHLRDYLRFLGEQFDIPEEESARST
jgi:hypothetical protein